MYKLCNDSSFLDAEKEENLDSEVKVLNDYLETQNEEVHEIEFEEDRTKYKQELMTAYKGMCDPFIIEIVGDVFEYEQNPADPSHPTK